MIVFRGRTSSPCVGYCKGLFASAIISTSAGVFDLRRKVCIKVFHTAHGLCFNLLIRLKQNNITWVIEASQHLKKVKWQHWWQIYQPQILVWHMDVLYLSWMCKNIRLEYYLVVENEMWPLFYSAAYLLWKLLYSLARLVFISSSSDESKAVYSGWADTRGNKSWAKGRFTPPLSPSHTHPLRASKLDRLSDIYNQTVAQTFFFCGVNWC